MAKKISQLTQATQVKSDDVTVIVQDGETKKLPLNMMVTKQDIENKKVAGLAKLDEIEATYENDTYTPTITVKNKSSVKVGEGDGVDYSANVMDGHVKSAILKGQTLVNLFSSSNKAESQNTVALDGGFVFKTHNDEAKFGITSSLFKPNTTYLIIFESDNEFSLQIGFDLFAQKDWIHNQIVNGVNTLKLTTVNEKLYHSDLLFRCASIPNDITITNIRIIEYQDGMENWDIPYFEGMQSVKMPVLTTMGKNLFDINNLIITDGTTGMLIQESDILLSGTMAGYNSSNRYIKLSLNRNTDYTIQFDGDNNVDWVHVSLFNAKTFERTHYLNGAIPLSKTFNTGDCDEFLMAFGGKAGIKIYKNSIQIEQGTTATTYEPYKTNILTVNEPVELRGIGDVKDELDGLTGQMIERVGETVLNGSENWLISGSTRPNHLRLYLPEPRFKQHQNVINNRFADNGSLQGKDIEGVYMSNTIDIQVEHSRLSEVSVNGFKNWLRENNIKVQAILSQESIKTVDLMPSGTHPSTTPYCWKNGHIQLSSSGLLPNLEYSVATSRAGQISQNAAMIVKNDKRIFDLEILLAGGLVNTTYQTLTLQNQVETGLSKVSLNSETEPDYLLYHMIMKLIEEKAYKLDDLTEKVSVFYLYEKLSDEQFETIYSALYPFVEDEIVEEPVVEELPEVVEDEVIM